MMREAGLVVGRTLALLAPAVAPGHQHRRPRRHRRVRHPRRGRGARRSWATTASRPRSAPRSTTRSCTASRARTRCCARATSSRSTAARSSTAGTATRRSRVPVGEVSPELQRLIEVTEESMWRGLAAARLGGQLSDISHAIEEYVAAVRLRHRRGVRRPRHRHRDAPGAGTCPTTASPAAATSWSRGWPSPSSRCSTSAAAGTRLLDDGWTVVTTDGLPSAHFEHTVHRDRRRPAGC